MNIDLILSKVLIKNYNIKDVHILSEMLPNKKIIRNAYIVAPVPLNIQKIKKQLTEDPVFKNNDINLIEVSTIPLTQSGQIDEVALKKNNIPDEHTIDIQEKKLLKCLSITHAAILSQPKKLQMKYLHLTDVLDPAVLPKLSTITEESELPQSMTEPVTEDLVAINFSMKQAFSDGGPLIFSSHEPQTLGEALYRAADKFNKKGILFIGSDETEQFQSYPQILENALRILTGLRNRGLQPKQRVILQIEESANYFAAFWGCVLGGIIPVTVTPPPTYEKANSVLNKLFNIWELLEKPFIIASEHLLLPFQNLKNFMPMDDLSILSVHDLLKNQIANDPYISKPDDVLFYQLTSGSTGTPKCIQITHQGVVAHIHGSQQFNKYCEEDITLNWLPMDHVVPILTCHLKDTYLGCNQIEIKTKDILIEPTRWLDYLTKYHVTHSWSPNFGYKLIIDQLKSGIKKDWDLTCVKFLMNAGEQATLPVIRDFLDLTQPYGLHADAMQPAFGMAEACTCMTYRNDFNLKESVHHIFKSSLSKALQFSTQQSENTTCFIDLGKPVPGIQIRITDEQNQVLPEDVIGRFQIKGPVITPGYFNNPSANNEAFVGDDWFNSGDLGFIHNGSLTLTGREKEMIIVRGTNYYCYEIEDIVSRVEGVLPTFIAACGIHDPVIGTEGLIIFFVTSDWVGIDLGKLVKMIKTKVATEIGLNPLSIIPILKDAFPKTTSGKIQRGQLKKSFINGEFKELCKEVDLLLENANTIPNWFYKRVWCRDNGREWMVADETSQPCYLILSDNSELGEFFANQNKKNSILVKNSHEFKQNDNSSFNLNFKLIEDYQHLFQILKNHILKPTHIIYLNKTQTEISDVSESLEKFVVLIRALNENYQFTIPFSLLVITHNTQYIIGDEQIDYRSAELIGAIHSLSQENANLEVKQIDLELTAIDDQYSLILNELKMNNLNKEIAYRGKARYISKLQRIAFEPNRMKKNRLIERGFYIISGGLGGVGKEISEFLLTQYKARLLILGKTSKDHVINGNNPQSNSYNNLIKLSMEIEYETISIESDINISTAIEMMQDKYQVTLSGIFHLAGEYHECYLHDEQVDSIYPTVQSKLGNAIMLNRMLKKYNKEGLFINFGSIYGNFGSAMLGVYAAANRALEAFTYYQRQSLNIDSFCLIWTNWHDLGMSKGYPPLLIKGFRSLSVRQGLQSLEIVLRLDEPCISIGLDETKRLIMNHFQQCTNLYELNAYFTAEQKLSRSDLNELDIHCIQCRTLPILSNGDINKTALMSQLNQSTTDVIPQNNVEIGLIDIWQDLLKIDEVHVEENFFELGGNSMLLLQLTEQLQQQYDKNIAITDVFKYPTIRSFSQYIIKNKKSKEMKKDQAKNRANKSREFLFKKDLK